MKNNYMKCDLKIQMVVMFATLLFLLQSTVQAQHSVARKWNEILLLAIRNDFARPPVHARNLFHVSVSMYDAWAAYDPVATPWLLGKWNENFYCPFDGVSVPSNIQEAREKAISFAAYRIIMERFKNSPGKAVSLQAAADLMSEMGYEPDFTDTNYASGNPASLGNYIAAKLLEFGLQDGSNEGGFYQSRFYSPSNPPLIMTDKGNPFLINPNRWQPLFLETFIDQSGNVVPSGAANFLSPEWGGVTPFALKNSDKASYQRDGDTYKVYHDPGPPPLLQADGGGTSADYKWGFSLVSKWGAHLDHTDGVVWDVSPGSIGNVSVTPTTSAAMRSFYAEDQKQYLGSGHSINPKTDQPYEAQLVPRGDYTRVLAEFWSDGPASETPPGHWFTILNYVNDHPLFQRKYKGEGNSLDILEWDVKAYFTLGGAMHDAAISCWGIKGWYDYIRPVSAIRFMADRGQSSNTSLSNYSPRGIPLEPGLVELVQAGDPLAGGNGENIGKIKLYTWRGPAYIQDPTIDFAGIGWILAEDWWPYQRPTFVTPPFAGYTSGHSTYSRAAAEVLTSLTGDDYFPGGLGEFYAQKDVYLEFEEGPSVDVILQWATYRDAADQCSLSRIWGGIHPPQDDIPGRIIGKKVGTNASAYAENYFYGLVTGFEKSPHKVGIEVFPNPVLSGDPLTIRLAIPESTFKVELLSTKGEILSIQTGQGGSLSLSTNDLPSGFYIVRKVSVTGISAFKFIIQ
jgi:hypothetical protein